MKTIYAAVLTLCFLPPATWAQSSSAYTQARLREYSRAIHILQQGLNEGWTREQYFKTFDSGGGHGPAKNFATKEVRSVLERKLPERAIWDEKPPLSVQVTEAITACYAMKNMIRTTKAVPTSPPV